MRRISLNGPWDFVPDLDPKYHVYNPRVTVPTMARPDVNRRHWQQVTVPGVWQKYGQRYEIFEGVCFFAREFEVGDLPAGAASRLRFSAVNYLTRVFVNGTEVGSHETGYTEFTLDTTDALRSGTNHVAVIVDNRAEVTKWPACLGYFNYGGIHRGVTLEIIDTASLDRVTIETSITGRAGVVKACGLVAFAEPGHEVRVSCDGVEADGTVADGRFQAELRCPTVEPWAPDTPRLYTLRVQLRMNGAVIDEQTHQCGFRSVCVRKGRIHLNEQAVHLKGICYVYDSPRTGLVMTEDQIDRDLALVKQLGCNAIRTHYPMDSAFYRACDRAGLLLWIEPVVYCLHPPDDARGTAFADDAHIKTAETMIDEMIEQARNHPCVVMYGIGNECNLKNPEAMPFFERLVRRIRGADPTRLVSYAALYGLVGGLGELVDVLGVNSYWGWYDKCMGGKGLQPEGNIWQSDSSSEREPIDLTRMREMIDQVLAINDDVALLLTEFGADSVPGFLSSSRDLWSEDYHADLLVEIIHLAKAYPQIVGTFPFCLTDYRDPSKVVNGYWDEKNLKGVVDYQRRPKKAFYALRNGYTQA